MSLAASPPVLRRLRAAALAPGAGDIGDELLLQRYRGYRDEAAFRALIRRHGPMVIGIGYTAVQEDPVKTGYWTIRSASDSADKAEGRDNPVFW